MAAPSAVLREWNVGTKVRSLCLNKKGNVVAGVLEDGNVLFLRAADAGEEPHILPVDEKGVAALASDTDEHAFLAIGASGALYIVEEAVAAPTEIARENGLVAAIGLDGGRRAYACGKKLQLLDETGQKTFALHARATINALAFCAEARLLAVAHDKGVSLLGIGDGKQIELSTPEACGDVLWAAKGKSLLMTGKQDSVWLWHEGEKVRTLNTPLKEKITLRPSGRTAGGQQLVLAGGKQGVLMDAHAQFRLLGGADARHITHIAPHPTEPFVAMGYDDGLIVFSPLDGRTDILVHAPVAPQGSGVAGLVWNGEGDTLVAALESGWVMLLTQKSVHTAVKARLN